MDTPMPLECLVEEEIALEALKAGNYHGIPSWLTPAEAIKESEESLERLKAHITKHGNTWV